MAEQTQPPAPPEDAAALKARRKRWLAIVAGGFAVIGIAYGAYWALALRYFQSTDDAYVSGNIVQITPQISGTVVAIGADDTQFVKAGQMLVQLDQADAKIALDQAEAQLGKTVREVRNLFATSASLQATLDMRQSDLTKANEDLARRERLANSGAISREEQQHARDAVDSAKSALLAAQQQLVANRARVDRTTIEDHPDVRNAAAHWRDAYLAHARTALPAPVAGFVAKRAVQLGQRVSPGAALMAIVPLDQVWVDANFKEPQLESMRLGQPVMLTADIYGSRVKYHGKVIGFGAGTGSAFAVLPAQNATGNWIKIVQRVPVRIALDPQELAAHPLQIGLSMQVEVDTHDRSGDRLPQLAQSAPAYATEVFRLQEEIAEQRVKAIIAANQGEASRLAQGRGRDDATSERFAQSDRAKSTTAATGRAGTVN
ncbi:MAG: HlyD family efflux transporter periplasmic adaptor subunit [Betaproteobacteria bacterium]|nr:MAG: HlyD family efflux transporter periplasmic adaptor subunit [Betaproteobacteria bacterium]